jgi:hypothetical protein
MRYIVGSIIGLVLLSSLPAQAQIPPVKNPNAVEFTSADHATITGYEVDILSGATVISTLVLGKGTLAGGIVTLPLNVQPIAFGTYTLRIRAVASATLKSENSVPSDPWDRVPGPPSKPTIK